MFGTGQVVNPLAAYLAGQGIAVRPVSRHRPPALADVARAPARAFTGIGHNLPQQALQAFAQTVTDVDGL